MSRILCQSSVQVKKTRKSPHRDCRFGAGLLRTVPSIGRQPYDDQDVREAAEFHAQFEATTASTTPSQLASAINALIASSQELGRRQDALLAAIRNPLPPIAGGAPQDHSDADLEEMYLNVQWLDRLDAMHRDPADELR